MKIESMEQLLASDEFKKEQEELQAVIKSIVGKYNTHAAVQTVQISKTGNEQEAQRNIGESDDYRFQFLRHWNSSPR